MIIELNPVLCDADGCSVLAFEGYADGSFDLIMQQQGKENVVKAFDEKGEPVRKRKMPAEPNCLPDVRFFNLGCAVRKENDIWQLFSAGGYPLRQVSNVVDFVGDGNVLVADDKVMKLVSFDGTVLVDKPIVNYEIFLNGCFVLVFADGSKQMYKPEGKRKSELVKNSVYLPDGCFVHYDGNLISGVYRPDGILRCEIYSFQVVGYYYLFSGEFYSGALYDDEGQEIGKNYVLLKQQDNFCLFEHEGQYELFNQFGKVATFFK